MAALVPKLVKVTVPEGVSPGDTINVEAEGQTVQCQVPADMKPGDTFQVSDAARRASSCRRRDAVGSARVVVPRRSRPRSNPSCRRAACVKGRS
jgi:hypothetical protein